MKTARVSSPVRDGWNTPGAYATSAEVAEYLAVVPATIQRWARLGKIPATHLTGRRGILRFRKTDIEKWVTAGTKATA